jgi:hypothetical protein
MASTSPPPLYLDVLALPIPNLDDLDIAISNRITLPSSAKSNFGITPSHSPSTPDNAPSP